MKNKPSPLVEFKPALTFLAVFMGLYVTGNVVYGLWIEYLRPQPDPMTIIVTRQVASLLMFTFEEVTATLSPVEPIVILGPPGKIVIRVFEGCNGINVMIVFVAFVIAFRRPWRKLAPFMLMGLVVIYVSNIMRVTILYLVAVWQPLYFYYFHKYLFTALLYSVVFLLWYIWVQSELNAQRRVDNAEK